MGAKRDSWKTPDLQDITEALWEFEKQNKLRLHLSIEHCLSGGVPDLRVQLQGVCDDPVSGEVRTLVSVSVLAGALGLGTLNAVVFRLLYMADGRLADEEMVKIAQQRA